MPQAEREEGSGESPVECDRDMGCLKGQKELPLCQVEKPIADLLFVTARPFPSCRYMCFFGNGAYCTCPVRKELHKRHGV